MINPPPAHLGRDLLGDAAAIERVGAIVGDPPERDGQIGLDQPIPGTPGPTADAGKYAAEFCTGARHGEDFVQVAGQVNVDRKPLGGQFHRRQHQLAPGAFAPAAMRHLESAQRAGHAHGFVRVGARSMANISGVEAAGAVSR